MIAIFTGVAFVLNIPSFFEFRPTLNKENKWELTELRYLKRRAFRDAVFITHCIGQYRQQSLTPCLPEVLLFFQFTTFQPTSGACVTIGLVSAQNQPILFKIL